jgi:hypothetical protein
MARWRDVSSPRRGVSGWLRVKSFFKWATGTRRIHAPPPDRSRLPGPRKSRSACDLFTGPEDPRSLPGCRSRDGALFQLMFDTGARRALPQRQLRAGKHEPAPDAPAQRDPCSREGRVARPAGADHPHPRPQARGCRCSRVSPSDLWWTRPRGGTRISRGTGIGNGELQPLVGGA